MRVAQYKDVVVNARYDSGVFQGFNVMVLSDRSYAPRGLDEYLSKDQIASIGTVLSAITESIIRATEDAARA